MNDKIAQLRKQIEIEETKIRNCKHDFGDSYFDPETVMELKILNRLASLPICLFFG